MYFCNSILQNLVIELLTQAGGGTESGDLLPFTCIMKCVMFVNMKRCN
jgi:hypothetical protein